MVEENLKNIQTMKGDILRLKEEGNLLPREEVERQKKVEDERRIKIENEIKRAEEDERKKEEQELLRIRKEERKNDLEVDFENEKEAEEEKRLAREMIINKENSTVQKPLTNVPEKKKVVSSPPMITPKPAEPTKEDLLEKISEFQKERGKIAEGLKTILEKKQPIEFEKNSTLAELNRVKKSFQAIVLKEQEIENSQKDLEEKEILAQTLKDRKKIEKERWVIEEKRRGIEQQRWPWDQKIKTLDEKVKEVEEKALDLSSSKVSLENKIEEINKQEERVQKEIRKIELKEELEKIKIVKINIEKEKEEVVLKLKEVDVQLQTILAKEKDIEEDKAEIESKESEETDLIKKRELEKQRWEMDEKRRQVETIKWKIDEEKSGIEIRIKKIEERMELVSEKEKSLMEEISPKPAKPENPPKIPESPEIPKEVVPVSETVDRDSDLEQAKRRIEMLRKSKEPKPETKPAPLEVNAAKKELEKKVLDLKELERQRLIDQEKRRKELLGRLKSPLEVQSRDNVLPKPKDFVKQLPKKPSGTEKIWLRILIVSFIVIVLTAILTFWYWYFKVKNAPEPLVESQIEITPPVEEIKEEIKTFAELDYLFDSEIKVVITEENIKDSLLKILQENQIDDKFIRVTFEGIGLREFNNSLAIVMPEDFYNKVEDDFLLFIYSQPQGKRLGIIAKTTDSAGLGDILKIQETTMESDLKSLFELSGQTKPAIVSYFRNASDASGYDGPNFRYKTVNTKDVGICYGLLNDYFILSSSWKSTETLLNKLK
ncbi:hypothetical protein KKA24_00530 [Patescibacteria group bacterium]|nr:hypothetical protein [Patescibacteria group bacterium]